MPIQISMTIQVSCISSDSFSNHLYQQIPKLLIHLSS